MNKQIVLPATPTAFTANPNPFMKTLLLFFIVLAMAIPAMAQMCPGDVTDSTTGFIPPFPPGWEPGFDINLWDGPDGDFDLNDLQAIIQLLVDWHNTNGNYVIDTIPALALPLDVVGRNTGYIPPHPGHTFWTCSRDGWDAPDGKIDLFDLFALVGLLKEEYCYHGDFIYPCPNPSEHYTWSPPPRCNFGDE